jgi:hypothetical protein
VTCFPTTDFGQIRLRMRHKPVNISKDFSGIR